MTERQLTEADLTSMTPEAIEDARAAGRLRRLLGGAEPVPATGQLTAEHTAVMSPEEIVAAQDAGRLDVLLGRAPATPPSAAA
jgi:hypothetical protein